MGQSISIFDPDGIWEGGAGSGERRVAEAASCPAAPKPAPKPHHKNRDGGPLSWADRAACAGMPTELFFPAGSWSQSEHSPGTRTAKAICANCPVRQPCLEFAMRLEAHTGPAVQQRNGIYGGLLPRERAALVAGEAHA